MQRVKARTEAPYESRDDDVPMTRRVGANLKGFSNRGNCKIPKGLKIHLSIHLLYALLRPLNGHTALALAAT